jgi:hypothetical protein
MSANESSTQSNRIYAVVFWVLAATAIAWGIFGILQSSDQAEKAFPLIADESLEIHLAQRPLSFEEILKGSNEASFFQRFENSAKAITGNDQVHVWIRIPIENTNRHPETWIIEVKQHLTSLCRMFIPNSGGTYEVYQSIPSIDPSIRQTPYPVPAFQVNLAAGEQKILYLKLQDANWISPQIRFWDSPIEFQKSLESDARFVNRYIGLLIGLFIANLAAFIAFRYKDVGYYLLYLVPAFIVNVLNFNVYGIEHWKLSGINQTSFTPDINHFLFYGFLILTAALHLLFVT